MSTRANIIIKDKDSNDSIICYSHYDGYPDGVGNNLKEFIAEYNITHKSISSLGILDKMIKCDKDFHYEIVNSIHGDIEYLYIINCYPSKNSIELHCYNAIPVWDQNYDKDWFENEKYLNDNLIF